jgi:hypothetical protein
MSYKSFFDISVTIGEVFVPINSSLQSFFPAHLFSPSKLMQLCRINGITQIIEIPIRNISNVVIHLILLSKNLNEAFSNIDIGKFILSSNVVNTANLSIVEDAVECTCNISDVKEVTGVTSVPMNSHRQSTQDLVDELGNQLLGELMRSVDVVSSSDDNGKLERAVVGFNEEFRSSLGCGIGVSGFQDVLFVHGLAVEGLSLSVNLIGRNVDEALHSFAILGAFKKHMGSEDVCLRECEGVTERIVYVGLSCKVHDGVNLILLEDVVDQITTGNVSLDEFKVWKFHYLLQILKTGTIVELIVSDDIVLGVLLREKDGSMGADET